MEKDFDKEAIANEIANSNDNTDETDVVAAAAARMEALGFDPSADEIVPEDEPVPAEDLEDIEDDDEEDDDLESEDEEDDDSTPEDADDEPVDKDGEEVDKDEEAQEGDELEGEPQLSDAYYRAAIHSGMDEEQITNFMKLDPKLALKTFGNLYETMNRASQEFADLGRFKKQEANKGTDEEPKDKPGFKKIDTTVMRDEHGDEVADQFDAQQQQLADLYEMQTNAAPVVNKSDQDLQDEQTKHAADQIESFFNSADMAQYEESYGKVAKGATDWTGLMPGENMNRLAVIERAEELLRGSEMLGREITVEDALGRAHLLVTQPIREKIMRKNLMGKVIKRAKGITLKPSNKVAGAVTKGNAPASAEEIEGNAAQRLAKLFR